MASCLNHELRKLAVGQAVSSKTGCRCSMGHAMRSGVRSLSSQLVAGTNVVPTHPQLWFPPVHAAGKVGEGGEGVGAQNTLMSHGADSTKC